MSKESREAGLHRKFHGAPEREKAKREEGVKQGRFVPDSSDHARLLPRLAGASRRT